MHIFTNNIDTIGNTPLVKLQHFGNHNIFAKIESRNPSFSVKCRIGANMVWQAEKDGILTAGKEIIEATSGNTGIALAFVAAAKGYKITLTMPETMSIERRRLLRGLGVNLILTPGSLGMKGAINKAEELVQANPNHYVLMKQFENPANVAIHVRTTGPEIWQDTDGEVDVVVAGVGTGGTISGISQYIKQQQHKAIISVAVEPSESPVITQYLKGEELQPGLHKIQGIGAGFIPKTLDLSVIDLVETIDSETALKTARLLMSKEGILAGISSGAAVAVADRLSKQAEFKDKKIVVILPSASERYLSTAMFTDIEA